MQIFKKYIGSGHPPLGLTLVSAEVQDPGPVTVDFEVNSLGVGIIANIKALLENTLPGSSYNISFEFEEVPPGSSGNNFVNQQNAVSPMGPGCRVVTDIILLPEGLNVFIIKATVTDSFGRTAIDTIQYNVNVTLVEAPDTTYRIVSTQNPENSGQGSIQILNIPNGVTSLQLRHTLSQSIEFFEIFEDLGNVRLQVNYPSNPIDMTLVGNNTQLVELRTIPIIANQVAFSYVLWRTNPSVIGTITMQVQITSMVVPSAPNHITQQQRVYS